MTSEITNFLENLDGKFNPIKNQAIKYFDSKSEIRNDGTVQIYNRPWIAPLNFGLFLFPAADKLWINIFEEKTGLEIPSIYKEILLNMNGCHIYNFSLYGLPRSIYENELLDRSSVQPLSLESANTFWKINYNISKDFFYIGGREYNEEENLGYFINGNKIVSVKTNGEILNSWNSFNEFLDEEIDFEEKNMLQTMPNH